jgi:hypothetical protein
MRVLSYRDAMSPCLGIRGSAGGSQARRSGRGWARGEGSFVPYGGNAELTWTEQTAGYGEITGNDRCMGWKE